MKLKTHKGTKDPPLNNLFIGALRIKGITAKDFARRYGFSRSTVWQVIHGQMHKPDLKNEIHKFIRQQLQKADEYLKLKPD